MGASKTSHYPDRHNEMAVIAKALGHPARITIIEYLLDTVDCNCKEIVDLLPLTQPTVSQHLSELRSAGLIVGVIEGNEIYYRVDSTRIERLRKFLGMIGLK